tara:strand:- start:3947 stop:4384 length:438 start_codon:yes stop_codon:yes gene_type:complete
MRYYIDGLLNININELVEYLKDQYDEKIILANDGYYKYINNELYKYKISNSNSNNNIIIQLNKNIKVIGTNTQWKKYDKVYKIPFSHKCINKKIYKFKITKNITLIVEKIENKIQNLYFMSSLSHDNYFFKEEVISFLSSVNKYL